MNSVFGTKLFAKKKNEKLYDFAQHGILNMQDGYGFDSMVSIGTIQQAVNSGQVAEVKKQKNGKKGELEVAKTPKELYQAKVLNTEAFTFKIDPEYIDKEVGVLEKKLALYPEVAKPKRARKGVYEDVVYENGAVKYGRQEVQSMIERLQNRQKISANKKIVDEYPHTTSDAIRQLLKDNKHLEARTVDGMLPDLPEEAIDAITKYKAMTNAVSGKDPVFYLIAEKVEERAVQRKRDPILLAQSPFGFFWQILGAWDKEVVLLDEL